jgi:hypothetical protein
MALAGLLLDLADGLAELILGERPLIGRQAGYDFSLQILVNILGLIVVAKHVGGEPKSELGGS